MADPDAGYTAAVADVSTLLPSSISGYKLLSADHVGPDAQQLYLPSSTGSGIRQVLVAVHDRGSKAAARRFATGLGERLYPGSVANIAGRSGVVGRFGTDRTRLAAVFFSRGRFGYEIVMTADGVAPRLLRDRAQALLKEITR